MYRTNLHHFYCHVNQLTVTYRCTCTALTKNMKRIHYNEYEAYSEYESNPSTLQT